ncbi:MAG: Fic family protein [Candidatus Berkelbacteria bacterium Licking1014_7]|uniref:Fic family protein n=1 Tax=Candidatus Berkelbacteria bacterium Licking1014_7 TaxID=2017147 RepID=A0A554LIK5_9BACT|nr:MAG: Fic family protein [Candidatus Berkelbacteria bacterium Licking1014_7]
MKPYHPPKLPVKIDLGSLAKEIEGASFELGKLDGLHRNLPNPSLLIAPLITKEATISSKIEGTKSTVSDVFLYESGEKTKYPDIVEVTNYRKAMIWSMQVLMERKFNLSFMKELHSILLEDTRGHRKKGEFRKEQVFIGKEGATIEQATYIPPENILVPEYMENLEKYILGNDENHLVKAALIHYQFEAIHPFLDGNGRIGRLIIPLFLHQKGLLYQPILYLSGYYEKYRGKYIDALHHVDETRKYEEWVKFFLISVKEQAKETQILIQRITDLVREIQERTETVKSPYIAKVINFIFKKPIFTAKDLNNNIKANRVTSLRLIRKLIELGILMPFRPPKKRRLFVFKDLLRLL